MPTPSKQRYLFGQGDLPARRLRRLAEVFEPTTKAFLVRACPAGVEAAIDLGCGPGYTTRLVADTVRAKKTYGLDNAGAFLDIAKANAGEGIQFVQHDIREIPFPVPAAEVIFGRYILAHLPNVPALVESWGTQLRLGGVLLLEETEGIETSNRAFARYLEIVEAMLAHNGSQLYAGRMLRELDLSELTIESNNLAHLKVANRDAAAMFAMNLPAWRAEAFIAANYGADEITELERALTEVAQRQSTESEIRWGLRQCVFRVGKASSG